MDWLVVVQAAPQYALVAVVGALLIRVMRHSSTDRGDYRADLDAAEKRHAAEIARMREQHTADLEALRGELAEMRVRVNDLTRELDEERRSRWRAEDVAASARRSAQAAQTAVDIAATTTGG